MPCDCATAINCGESIDSSILTTGPKESLIRHTINHTVSATNLPVSVLERTVRNFAFSHSRKNGTGGATEHLVACHGGSGDLLGCGIGLTGGGSSATRCKESCSREINTPYYLDRLNSIFVYRHRKETLDFDITADKLAAFRGVWGTEHYGKICVPDSVQTKGTESIRMIRNGEETTLVKQEYSYNPFPAADMGGGTWGLYGNVVAYGDVEPDTKNVSIILLNPIVGKQATPLDKDVKFYGFYDYNAVEGGFTENGLSAEDGGKDYFYPYWLRQMPASTLWRRTADDRYACIYYKLEPDANVSWTADLPETYSLPFGSFATDSKDNFIYSCLCQLSDRAGGNGAVVNYASFGDLYKAIYTDNKITSGSYHDLFPVAPV